jgi:glycosyltransferase involved in cell wall biosynthesis/energy-coupling factor transporter ATP-binding protein EcfA2
MTFVRHPTKKPGLFVVLLGPDGSGKSTLADRLKTLAGPGYASVLHFHWRPNLLPKLSGGQAAPGRAAPAGTPPPTESKYGYAVSLARYLYYLIDFILGYWMVVYPRQRHQGLVIGERWHFDIVVHPERYGFKLPRWLIRCGDRLVPRPDLTVLLEANPLAIHKRKPELTAERITNQLAQMRAILPAYPNGLRLSTEGNVEESCQILAQALDRVSLQKKRWFGFPFRGAVKVWIDIDDRVRNGMNLYHPYSWHGRLAKWMVCHAPWLALRSKHPGRKELEQFHDYVKLIQDMLHDDELAVSFSTGTSSPFRKMTAQISKDGGIIAYAKISQTELAKPLLRHEAETLRQISGTAHDSFVAPRVLKYQAGEHGTILLLLSAPETPGQQRTATLSEKDAAFLAGLTPDRPIEVALDQAIGRLGIAGIETFPMLDKTASDLIDDARAAVGQILGDRIVKTGLCHGDYAPWNTLELTDGRLYVYDWEYARHDAPLFMDLFNLVFMPEWKVHRRNASPVIHQLLGLHANPAAAPVIQKAGVTAEEFPAYLLLYLIDKMLITQASEGSVPAFMRECMHHVLVHVGHPGHRRRVLVSAYACEPSRGSEPGVGWQWAQEISRNNEVWVITRKNNREVIENALATRSNPHLHFAYVDVPRWLSFWKRGPRFARIYYYLWQYAAWLKGLSLHRRIGFDLGHHVTFVNDWLWSFLALMPIPYVWGPIGSHPPCPRALFPHRVARLQEIMRLSIQRTARLLDPLYWLTAARAKVVLTINREIADYIPLSWLAKNRCVVEPAIGIDEFPAANSGHSTSNFTVLYAGRFHYVKCPHLAIEAFSILAATHPDARMVMIGAGPEENNLRTAIGHHGLHDRISLIGWMKQEQVLEHMRRANVFLFPSAEGAGMVVLEAMAQGLPVVCLDFAGPGQMVAPDAGIRVPLGSRDRIIKDLGTALNRLYEDRAICATMGKRAREIVEKRFRWSHKRKMLLTAYNKACSR